MLPPGLEFSCDNKSKDDTIAKQSQCDNHAKSISEHLNAEIVNGDISSVGALVQSGSGLSDPEMSSC